MANIKKFTGKGVITTYDTSGSYTWDKNEFTQTVTVIGWGGGGGGGSGRQGLTTAAAGGDGGGNGGCFFITNIPASFFGTTETVVVGVGGTGGAAQSSNLTDGNIGTDGTNSSIGKISTPIGLYGQYGGGNLPVRGSISSTTSNNKGQGGSNNGAATYYSGSFPIITNSSNSFISTGTPNTTATGGEGAMANGNGSHNPFYYGTDYSNSVYEGFFFNTAITSTAGGGGAGADATTERTGGNGTNIKDLLGANLILGGIGGVESGTLNGGAGNTRVTSGGIMTGGTGGGGGGGQKTGAAAGNGGNGGFPGGGGGGGGGSITGTNSGIGGNGSDGMVIVIEYF
jgi:hypothetical protein